MNNSPFLTTKQAAKIANVHPDTVRRWCEWGRLPAKKLGNTYAIVRDDLMHYIENEMMKYRERYHVHKPRSLYTSKTTILSDRQLVSDEVVQSNRQKLDEKIAMIQARMKDEKVNQNN